MTEMRDSLIWIINEFDELNIQSLYNILRLRSTVFVVEQNCPYQDLDNKDQTSTHLQGFYKKQLVAYCRLFKAGAYFEEAAIGRVVVDPNYRRYGFGHQLMDKAISLQKELFNEDQITISAQLYLKKFYESHGFKQTSDEYLEDNIPHIQMKRNNL